MLGSLTVIDILILIGCILVSLTIHEVMHAWVGFKLGDDTAAEDGRISLNPLKHIDPFMTVLLPIITIVAFGSPILAAKPVPFNPEKVKWEEFGVALLAFAGPFSNLLLAILAAVLDHLVVSSTTLSHILGTFMILNVSLFVFNLIPIPPLDGSRVLYAFAPDPIRRVMEQLEPLGLFIVFGLVILGFGTFISGWVEAILHLLPFSPFL